MDMRKEFNISGYEFAIGIIDNAHFTVGLKKWPGMRAMTASELRNYRRAMFQAQVEIKKMQDHVEKLLRDTMLG